jgi:hypothetical protein
VQRHEGSDGEYGLRAATVRYSLACLRQGVLPRNETLLNEVAFMSLILPVYSAAMKAGLIVDLDHDLEMAKQAR